MTIFDLQFETAVFGRFDNVWEVHSAFGEFFDLALVEIEAVLVIIFDFSGILLLISAA